VKRARFSAGIVVVRRFEEGWRCLMLRVYRNWDFPKGEVEAGESALQAAIRETAEEACLMGLNFAWGEIYLETLPYSSGKIARYYVAESAAGEVCLLPNPALGHPEHHEYRWMTFDEARKLAPPRLHAIVEWAAGVVLQP
jgi:bis(5'-nucleosidyl)-tetraphosphatase